ncbi:hypothetical protein XI03_06095 [Bradyrhizobium sp. CCBAU 65884]|uniref:DUF1236 domain-containing protein n=1 Tax=Bradyrhizobium sp. CCBAU 65884 TaxID=722477 RepID=UPI002306771F|nr:DUF1236 domain-containing protein [Bradyrhizobium sp. CCBAU 65884]MDA9474090.1 hypothetical protein [Bradyrhizobium sp. CCBAU 65884]
MLNRFMISVAAVALVAGAGLANAQDKGRDSGAGSQQMQHSQPSGGAAERGSTGRDSMSHDKGTVGQAGGAGTMKSDRPSEDKSGAMKDERPGGAMNKNAAEDKAGATKGQRTDERAQDKSQQDKSKSMSSDSTTKSDPAKSAKDMKAEDNKAGGAAKTNNAATTDKSQTTTGTASATASAPPAEKRTEISTAIKSTKIEETTNVNFNISVGTAIPASVRVHPLPPRIVEIYPEWRGYEVIFVRGQYVIVRPQTREIVYIIEG